MKEELQALAEIREDVVTIEGKRFHVREVGAFDFAEYGKMLKDDRPKATAALVAKCLLDGPGGQPLLTPEEALPIVSVARVSTPLVAKIMELSGFGGDDEKEPDAG